MVATSEKSALVGAPNFPGQLPRRVWRVARLAGDGRLTGGGAVDSCVRLVHHENIGCGRAGKPGQ
eukprot:1193526-Prorocentrum_minimum.AAC.2